MIVLHTLFGIQDGFTLIFFSVSNTRFKVLNHLFVGFRSEKKRTRDWQSHDLTSCPSEQRYKGFITVDDRTVRECRVSNHETFTCESYISDKMKVSCSFRDCSVCYYCCPVWHIRSFETMKTNKNGSCVSSHSFGSVLLEELYCLTYWKRVKCQGIFHMEFRGEFLTVLDLLTRKALWRFFQISSWVFIVRNRDDITFLRSWERVMRTFMTLKATRHWKLMVYVQFVFDYRKDLIILLSFCFCRIKSLLKEKYYISGTLVFCFGKAFCRITITSHQIVVSEPVKELKYLWNIEYIVMHYLYIDWTTLNKTGTCFY